MTRTTPRPEWIASGMRVRRAREAASLTKREVRRAIGLDPSALVFIESGRRGLSAAMRARLAAAFGCPVEALGEANTARGGHGLQRPECAPKWAAGEGL